MAFASCTAETPWNSLALAQEVYQAYAHRIAALRVRYTIADDYVSEPTTDTKVFTFIQELQTFIVNEAAKFYDPDYVLAGSAPDSYISNLAFNGTAFGTATGLSAVGRWRRIPEGTTPPTHAQWDDYDWDGYSYGAIQQKDVAGPWLWADIIAALEKLTRIHMVDDSSQAEAYRDYEQSPTIQGYSPLYGNISWGGTATHGTHFFELRRHSTGSTPPFTYSRFTLEDTKYVIPFYAADGVTSEKLAVYDCYGDPITSLVAEVTSSMSGQRVVFSEKSTFTSDGKSYFTAYILDKAGLTGDSREGYVTAEGIAWPTEYGYNRLLLLFQPPNFYLDYTFPDGPAAE